MVNELHEGEVTSQPYAAVANMQGGDALCQVCVEIVELLALFGKALHLQHRLRCSARRQLEVQLYGYVSRFVLGQ